MRRRDLLAAFISASVVARARRARGEQALTVIVPDLPGGAAGTEMRILQPYLEQTLAQPVILDFRPGAGGIVGLMAGAQAATDGTALTLLTPAVTLAPWLSRRMDCTPANFAPLGRISFTPVVLIVRADAPYQSIADLLSRRAAREELAAPAPSDWDPSQVAQALFVARAGLSVHAVGGLNTPAERLRALLAGDVDLAFAPLDGVLDPGVAGQVRILAVSSPARVPRIPEVPSLRDAGLDIAVGGWRALASPAGSPRRVIDQLSEALRTVMEGPPLRAELTRAGLAPSWLGPDEVERVLTSEYRDAGTLFASLGVSVRKQVLGLEGR